MAKCAGQLLTTVLALFAATLLAGCGQPAKGIVTGKVTVDDRPVRSGQLTFVGGPDGGKTFTIIGLDGRYNIDLKPGDYKVAVELAQQPAMMPGVSTGPPKAPKDAPVMKDPTGNVSADPVDMAKEAKNPVVVPPKYRAPETSGLTVTVPAKGITFDIPMKSK